MKLKRVSDTILLFLGTQEKPHKHRKLLLDREQLSATRLLLLPQLQAHQQALHPARLETAACLPGSSRLPPAPRMHEKHWRFFELC